MANDSFTEVTHQGCLSRLGEAIKGVLVGVLLLAGGVALLWFNEGRAVRTAKGLEEGAASVVTIPAAPVDPAMEGRLVHTSGQATTTETLADPELGVSATALALRRSVEMYQWKESSRTEEHKKLGGGTEKVTTYSYDKGWSSSLVDSDDFKKPEGHRNPDAFPLKGETWWAGRVTLGAHTLSEGLIHKLSDFEPLAMTSTSGVRLAGGQFAGMHLVNGGLYLGADPAHPQVGDMRVSFAAVAPGVVSIVAKQVGASFEPYPTAAGTTLEMLEPGAHSADSMFKAAMASNRMLTWLLRLGGFLLIFIGLAMVFRPFRVVADVVPLIGRLVGAGTSVLAFLLAVAISCLVIAVAWLRFRPVLGVALMVVVLGAIVLLVMRHLKHAPKLPAAPPPPAVPPPPPPA